MRALSAMGFICMAALASCGAPNGGGATVANVAAANSAGAPALGGVADALATQDVAISADQLPTVRAGSWQETTITNGGAPDTTLVCESGPIADLDNMGEGCNQRTYRKLAANGGYTIDIVCFHDASKSVMHALLKGDFNADYTADGTSTDDEPGHPTEVSMHHLNARYVGPCTPGEMTGRGLN